MSAPSVTDWISAASSVAQTVGALLAIGVTMVIARRTERESARRELESVRREADARAAADKRADLAIAQAAAAEKVRTARAESRLVAISLGAIDTVIEDLQRQLTDLPSREPLDPDQDHVYVDWTSSDTCIATLRSLTGRTEDPYLGTLLEQVCLTLMQPERANHWHRPSALIALRSLADQLGLLRVRVEEVDAYVMAAAAKSLP